MTAPRGFTLIELLVVITIIATLAAILFPVFATSREKGRQTACASNMRQIGVALRMYADDYEGEMPRTSHGGFGGSPVVWIQSLAPYVQNVYQVRACPSDQFKEQVQAKSGTSYVMNEYVSIPQEDFLGNPVPNPEVFTGLDDVPRPAETMMLFELGDEKPRDGYWDHTHSRTWFQYGSGSARWNAILAEIEPDRHRSGAVPAEPDIPANSARRVRYDRTKGVANYLYCDAHVKAIPAGRIKAWAEEGFNFAKPLR